MKELPVLFTAFLLCFYFSSVGQTIEYDFSTTKLTKPKKIKEGESVLILYKGVNKYALKSSASITSGNRSYDDGLSQLQAGLAELSGEKKKAEDKKADTDAALVALSPAPSKTRSELTAMQTYLAVKATKLADIEREFNNIYEEVLKINSIMSMDKDITAATNDPTLNSQALIEGAVFIQTGTTGIAAPADFTSVLASCLSNIRISLSTITLLIIDLKNNFTNAVGLTAEQRKEEGPKIDELLAELKKRVTTIENTYSGQNLKTLQDNAADMGRRSLKLLNQDFTIAPTVIGNADGDYIEISDKLTDNDGKQIFEIKPFKINTYGGSRVDFSIGLSVNIGGHGKYKYDLRKNPTNATSGTAVDSVILLSDDEDRLFKFSPAIFVHWYKNSQNMKIQWMLTTGLTPNFTELSDTRLSIGTSLGLPSSNGITRRLILSVGFSFGYADVLKTKYKNLVDFRSFGDLDASDLTEKALKVGAFFSVSYNLGGVGHD